MKTVTGRNQQWFETDRFVTIWILLILGLGLAIRLFDLTDLPLDFHPTRQLRSAIIARGMYAEMQPFPDDKATDSRYSSYEFAGRLRTAII